MRPTPSAPGRHRHRGTERSCAQETGGLRCVWSERVCGLRHVLAPAGPQVTHGSIAPLRPAPDSSDSEETFGEFEQNEGQVCEFHARDMPSPALGSRATVVSTAHCGRNVAAPLARDPAPSRLGVFPKARMRWLLWGVGHPGDGPTLPHAHPGWSGVRHSTQPTTNRTPGDGVLTLPRGPPRPSSP